MRQEVGTTTWRVRISYQCPQKLDKFKGGNQKTNKKILKVFLSEFPNDKIIRGKGTDSALPLRNIPEIYRISILKEDLAKTNHIKGDIVQEKKCRTRWSSPGLSLMPTSSKASSSVGWSSSGRWGWMWLVWIVEAFERLRTYWFRISHVGELTRQSLGKYVRKIYIWIPK